VAELPAVAVAGDSANVVAVKQKKKSAAMSKRFISDLQRARRVQRMNSASQRRRRRLEK